jgi:hypothetical protein
MSKKRSVLNPKSSVKSPKSPVRNYDTVLRNDLITALFPKVGTVISDSEAGGSVVRPTKRQRLEVDDELYDGECVMLNNLAGGVTIRAEITSVKPSKNGKYHEVIIAATMPDPLGLTPKRLKLTADDQKNKAFMKDLSDWTVSKVVGKISELRKKYGLEQEEEQVEANSKSRMLVKGNSGNTGTKPKSPVIKSPTVKSNKPCFKINCRSAPVKGKMFCAKHLSLMDEEEEETEDRVESG